MKVMMVFRTPGKVKGQGFDGVLKADMVLAKLGTASFFSRVPMARIAFR